MGSIKTVTSNNIDWIDYVLISIGIILLPVFLIGLIPIGWAVFRIGDKMRKHKEETDKQVDWEMEEIERKYRKDDVTYLDPEKIEKWT